MPLLGPQDSGGCWEPADPCVPTRPGPGRAPEPRSAVEGAVGGQSQPVARPLPGPAGPCTGAALPLGPPDAHPPGHGEALGAPAAVRAPAGPRTLRGALGPATLRLEPPAPQAPCLRGAPGSGFQPRRDLAAPVLVGPRASEPLRRRRPGLGVGAGLGRSRGAPLPAPPSPARLPSQPPRPLAEFSSPRSRHGSGSYGPEPVEARSASQLEPDRRSLPRTPSACEWPRSAEGGPGPRGLGGGTEVALQQEGRRVAAGPGAPTHCAPPPHPAASLYASGNQRSRSNSFGERPGGGGGGGGARRVRALVSHSEGANHTLLRFSAGDVVEVLVPEAQNGWLYGKLEGSSA